ncbi:MAG: rhodanese-like domain-containing protein [Mongoliibacter sp.]|uniref:rhodanese-like domain-containing protein n=1 Tax=Mongoliibacter sp. TaxID=2022438 RepID=UPI0012F0E273|nr:rhodanese-like domain-containing protein [Mongoliibacter sp.]TVP45208.1 MAG: rhodanese-like domain-containing protein [Mongoliibacter sp.]
MKRILNDLLSICAILIIFSGCNIKSTESNYSDEKIKNVDQATFLKLISEGDGILVDVRTQEEISNGVIAEPLKIDFLSKDFYEKLNELPKDKEIYLYCAVGARSAKAAEYLKEKGYPKVYNLEGGYVEWVKNGYTVK